MNSTSIFEIIKHMYCNEPFLDEQGYLTYIPSPVDRLLNAFILVESLMYSNKCNISSERYSSFLKDSLEFLNSIPVEVFSKEVVNLENSSKNILLRNFDKILLYDSQADISKYVICLI